MQRMLVQNGMTLNVPTLDEYGRAVYQNKTLNVKIPKGIAEGQQIRLAGQGLPGYNGGENGDLYLKIKFHDQPDLYVKKQERRISNNRCQTLGSRIGRQNHRPYRFRPLTGQSACQQPKR